MIGLAALATTLLIMALGPANNGRLTTLQLEKASHQTRLQQLISPRADALDRSARLRSAIVLGLVSTAFSWVFIPAIAAVSGVICAAIGYLVLGKVASPAAKKRRQSLRIQLPLALDLVAAEVAAGAPLGHAMTRVAETFPEPLHRDYQAVLAGINSGLSDIQAWSVLENDQIWRPIVADISISLGSGSAIGEVLAVHAERLREDNTAAQLVKAKSAGVKATLPLTICYLPAFVLVGIVPTIAAALIGLFA